MGELPASVLLARSAAELRALAATARRLDDSIGDLALSGPGATARAGWQEADQLRQGLEELARFLGALASAPRLGIAVDPRPAARQLVLRDLAARLSCEACPDGPGADPQGAPPDAGDFHLF